MPTLAPSWAQTCPLGWQDMTPTCGTSATSGGPRCSPWKGCSVPLHADPLPSARDAAKLLSWPTHVPGPSD